MKKTIGYGLFWTFVASMIGTCWSLVTFRFPTFLGFVVLLFGTGAYVFKDTLNLVQGIGFVYWITRDTHKGFSLSIAFMRETDAPWRTGNGLQIGIGKYSFQIGFCKRNKTTDESEGLTRAVKGRKLHYRPKEIREWR